MTSDSMPPIPPDCDGEVYITRWMDGYPEWYCEDEARAAAGEEDLLRGIGPLANEDKENRK